MLIELKQYISLETKCHTAYIPNFETPAMRKCDCSTERESQTRFIRHLNGILSPNLKGKYKLVTRKNKRYLQAEPIHMYAILLTLARRKARLQRTEVAKLMNYSHSQNYDRYENGSRRVPEEVFFKLLKVMKVKAKEQVLTFN